MGSIEIVDDRYTRWQDMGPPSLVADPSKLMNGLGWKPAYLEIEKTVETSWAWHSRNPEGYPE